MSIVNRVKQFYSQTAYVAKRRARGLRSIDEMSRFRILLTCIFCSYGVSIVNTFELYTTELSQRFGLGAGDQSTVSTVGVAFCYFVLPYAVLYEFFGPTPLMVIGLVVGVIGSLGLALIFEGIIPGNLVTICVFYAFLNTCSGIFDATSIVTLMEVFPRNRGPVLGLAKMMTGLGSSVFASLSRNLFGGKMSPLLFFMMAFIIVTTCTATVTLSLPPYFLNWWRRRCLRGRPYEAKALMALGVEYRQRSAPMRRIIIGYVLTLCLVAFFAISSPVVAYTSVSSAGSYALGALTLVFVLSFFVLVLPLRVLGGMDDEDPDGSTYGRYDHYIAAQRRADLLKNDRTGAGADLDACEMRVVSTAREVESYVDDNAGGAKKEDVRGNREECSENDGESGGGGNDNDDDDGDLLTLSDNEEDVARASQDPHYEGNFFANLRSPDLYLLYLGFILQGAIGTIVMYNSGTIYVALTGEQRSEGVSALYTAFLGVGSALGRLAVGVYEACSQQHRRVRLTMALPITPLIGIIGGLLILFLPGEALLLPYIMIYFKEGAFYSLCAVTFPSLYKTHHAIYYNLSSATTVLCVICFNRFLFGYHVDKMHDQLNYAKNEDCKQRKCIQLPIIVSVVLCFVSFCCLVFVHIRYHLYVKRVRAAALVGREHVSADDTDIDEDEEGANDTTSLRRRGK